MHRCLEIPDIFHHILDFVVLVLCDDRDPFQGHHNVYAANPILAALARTCRAFLEPSLNVLWHNQLSIGPLFRTLPADAVEEEIEQWRYDNTSRTIHHLYITRPLVQSDWARFDYYAAKIKRLGYYIVEFPDQAQNMWHAHQGQPCPYPVSRLAIADLCMYRRTPWLLPNLVALRWTNYDVPYSRHLPAFLGPNLRTLSLAFEHEAIAYTSNISNEIYGEMVNVVKSVLSLCPSLTDLEICPPREDTLVAATLPFLYNCQRLEGFKVTLIAPAWSKEVIQHLSLQQSLKRVFLSFDEETASDLSFLTTAPSLRYPFPALDTIYLVTPTLPSFTELIKAMVTCRLRLIKVDFVQPSNSQELYDLFVALWVHCSKPHLHVLFIETRTPRDYALNSEDHAFTFEMLLPMFDFQNIAAFIIAMPLMGYIADGQFAHIGQRWPRLHTLGLLQGWDWCRRSEITLAAVAFLAWTCPQLSSVSVAVDATIDNVAEVTSQPGFKPNRCFRFFDAMDSVMGDPMVFARAMLAFAPLTFRVMGSGWCERDEHHRELPPEQDPIGFFQAVNNLVYDIREREEDKRHEKSAEDWAATELEGLNPWAADAKPDPWARERIQWIPAEEWALGEP